MREGKKKFQSSSQRDGVHYQTASLWEMIMAPACAGASMCFYMLLMYASYIGSTGYGIATIAVGIIITASRVFDAVTDPLCAIIFEKIPAKHGKVRLFIFFGAVIEALSVLMMFHWAAGKFNGLAGMVLFIVIYFVYIIGYTFAHMGGNCMDNIITNDPSQRPMIGFLKTLYSYGIPILFNNIIAFYVLPKYDNQYNAPMLKEACYYYVITAMAFVVISCIGLSRVDKEEKYTSIKKKEKVTLKEMWEVLSKNKDVQRYVVTCATDKFAQTTASQSMIITLLNGVLIGSYVATQTANNYAAVIGLIFAFMGGVFISKVGARAATITWSWVSIALSGFMLVYCLFLGKDGMSQIGKAGSVPFIIYCIITIALTATKMILSTAGGTMKPDVVDGEELRSGNFLPSVVSGVYSMIDKLMSSICSTFAAFCIVFIGYKTTMPQMGDKITNGTFGLTLFLSFGLPILGWVCNLLAMRKYTLTKERMVEVQREIEIRRGANQAEA